MSKQNSPFNEFFKKLHTEKYKWYDFFLFPPIIAIVLLIAGQICGELIIELVIQPLVNESNNDFLSVFSFYFIFLFVWIVSLLYFYQVKRNRPIFNAITPVCKGNTIKYLLLGFIVGFIQNTICVVVALMHKDIHIEFASINVIQTVALFIVVFIQSGAEELLCRGFIYQRLRKAYRNPAIAVIGNSVLFSIVHVFNPGIKPLALLNICLVGICYSLFVYYFDSIWMAMAAHTAWNFTQNIIFGLPNSGNVLPFSIFKLDASTATDSFAYDVEFGVEATLVAAIVIIISSILVYLWGKKNNKIPTDIWN